MKRYFFCWLMIAACTVIQAQEKFALVIGNGAYTGIKRLNNPVNDAQDMTAALKGLGFTVETVLNGNLEQMESAVSRLRVHLAGSRNSYGFLFYAGHGVQSGGENYLLPVDANIPSENYLRQRAASVQVWLDELNGARNALNVVVLDACRDNPFGWGGRSGSRGMALVAHQPADSIIVFATAAGSTADDGPGRNGLFTGELLKNLKQEGAEVTELFLRTMGDVAQASGNKQRPAVYTQFGGKAYLGRKPQGGTASVAVAPQPAPAPRPAPVAPPEHPAPANMVRVAGGTFHMGSTTGDDDEKPVHQVTVKSFYMSKYEVTQKEWREVMGTSVAQQRDMAQRDQNGSGYQLWGEGDSYPMYYVSWLEAVEYCNKRSVKEGLRPA
ncbi:MAG: caspase family protein, partial [Treponema sp.]|nr:caspase family protein [Treponema sp.]